MENTSSNDLDKRVNDCKKEIGPILIKYNLEIGCIVNFPQYRILPPEVQLALQILNKHGVEYRTAFREVEEKK